MKELFSHTKKDEFYAFGKAKIFNTELHLGGIKATKSKEALILVSDHKMDDETLPTYQKRWEIDGFSFHSLHLVYLSWEL